MKILFDGLRFAIRCKCDIHDEFVTDNSTLEPFEVGGEVNDSIMYFDCVTDANIEIIELVESGEYESEELQVVAIAERFAQLEI